MLLRMKSPLLLLCFAKSSLNELTRLRFTHKKAGAFAPAF